MGSGNRPSFGGSATGRPGFLPGAGGSGGAGAINRPGGGSTPPGTTPGGRPNLPNPPNLGGPNRPNIGDVNRPNFGQGNRPGGGNDNRPNVGIGNRPNIGGGNIGGGNNINNPNIGNRPSIGNRPNINTGNQTGIVNRPGINVDNSTSINSNRPWYQTRPTRPSYENRPGINPNNRPNIGSNNNIFAPQINNNYYQQNNYNRPVVSGRPWYGHPWNAPTYSYHYGWHQGHWNYWSPSAYSPIAAYSAGFATGWLLGSPRYVYSNPYYVVPASTTTVIYDYSQPIPVTTAAAQPAQVNVTTNVTNTPPAETTTAATVPPAPQPDAAATDPKTQAAVELFDQARADFKQNNYDAALDKVNSAIQQMPSDPVLHEFRSLVLFAQGKYSESAGTIYAVLATGPGWDWDTMRSLYPNVDVYGNQVHKLEDYCNANPMAADVRFLLAYHYLTMGYVEEAKAELERVVELQPKDELSIQLVKLLSEEPKEANPPPPNS